MVSAMITVVSNELHKLLTNTPPNSMFFQLIKKYPPISMNHDPISMNNNILSVSPLYDGASDIQFIKPAATYTQSKQLF